MNASLSSSDTPRPVVVGDTPFKVWQCVLCGFTYDEAAGLPADGIAPGRTAPVPA